MRRASKLKQFVLGLAVGLCWTTLPAVAQSVTPTSGVGDASTQVSGTSAFTITGGSQQLNTLFHSFENFSPEAANVLFQLDGSQSAVEHVISRVTGSSLSFIDGQLKLTGGNNPDLFLINPNGITFGSNASLALPGSFITSTAESVLFKNGVNFSAVMPTSSPRLFGLPAFPTENAGDTQITTPDLSITDGAELSVRNEGTGEGGTLTVSADRIYLNANGNISAQTNVGNGGSINLSVNEVLLMRRGSLIDTESQSVGNGGNISITAPIIIGLENSDIVADAARGNGGNIDITTQSILGLKFREQRTSENDITASSEFGISGNVEINNLTANSALGLVELPSAPTNTDDQIATACASDSGNQFTASGRGGIPVSPEVSLHSNRPWIDFRGLSYASESEPNATAVNASESTVESASAPELVEASGWQRSQNGSIELLTAAIALNNPTPSACLAKTYAG